MKKVYIAPEAFCVHVKTEGNVLNTISLAQDGKGNKDEYTQVEEKDLPDEVEVASKGDEWTGGVGVWED